MSSDTVLVGHRLRDMMISIKLCHRNILDTSLLFEIQRHPKYELSLHVSRTIALCLHLTIL